MEIPEKKKVKHITSHQSHEVQFRQAAKWLFEYKGKKQQIGERSAASLFGIPRTTFARYWKSLNVEQSTSSGEFESVMRDWSPPQIGGPLLIERKIFTDDETDLFQEMLRQAHAMGFGIDIDRFRDFLVNAVTSLKKVDPVTGHDYSISQHFVSNFISASPDLTLLKTSSIDIRRAKQATFEVRDALFDGVDRIVQRLHESGKVLFKCFAECPPEQKYCYDEEGGEENSKRRRSIGSRATLSENQVLLELQ